MVAATTIEPASLPHVPLRPRGPFALVMRDLPYAMHGSIIVPDNAQRTKFSGTVLRVGPGIERVDGSDAPHEVMEGDWVFWPAYAENFNVAGALVRCPELEIYDSQGEKREIVLLYSRSLCGFDRGQGLRMLTDWIVIQTKDREKHSKGGIIIPDTANETYNEGRVIHCGPGPWDDYKAGERRLHMPCEEGDYVYWKEYGAEKHEALKRYSGKKEWAVTQREPILLALDRSEEPPYDPLDGMPQHERVR